MLNFYVPVKNLNTLFSKKKILLNYPTLFTIFQVKKRNFYKKVYEFEYYFQNEL